MLRTQAVGIKSCRPRSGLLTWHPSASTADSLLTPIIVIMHTTGIIHHFGHSNISSGPETPEIYFY
jgi:hypothetical protein